MNDDTKLTALAAASMQALHGDQETVTAIGVYEAICRDAEGNELWRETTPNVVCTIGKNVLLDAALAGAAYTVVGPFMGLISSVSFTAVAAADTMTSHAGWLEAGATNAPTYSGTRKTAAWAAASAGAKSLSAGLVFTFTGAGTVKGCFMAFGTGASNTVDSTAGTLLSAGAFTGGDQPVVNTNTLTVTYTLTLT